MLLRCSGASWIERRQTCHRTRTSFTSLTSFSSSTSDPFIFLLPSFLSLCSSVYSSCLSKSPEHSKAGIKSISVCNRGRFLVSSRAVGMCNYDMIFVHRGVGVTALLFMHFGTFNSFVHRGF